MRCGKKYVRSGHVTDDKIIRRIHIPCWITKATNTHSEYETHITCPWQHWLRQRVSILRLFAHCLPSSNMTLIRPLRTLNLWNWIKIWHFGVRIVCSLQKKKRSKYFPPSLPPVTEILLQLNTKTTFPCSLYLQLPLVLLHNIPSFDYKVIRGHIDTIQRP